MNYVYWLLTCCLIALCTPGATTQDDGDGGVSCPPLKIKALNIMCTNADGDDQDCNQPDVGTKARIQWRKNVVQGPGTVTDVVCKDNGAWLRVKVKPGGGGSQPMTRRTTAGDN